MELLQDLKKRIFFAGYPTFADDKVRTFLLLPFLLSLLTSGVAAAQTDGQHQKDSLRNVIAHSQGQEKLDAYMHLTNFYYVEARDEQKRDTLFTLYDQIDAEATKQGNDNLRAKTLTNRLFVLSNAALFDEVMKQTPGYLEFAEKKELWHFYYQMYGPLVVAYQNKGENENALEKAHEMLEHAKARVHRTGMGMALSYMSRIYQRQGRFTEQEECLRESIVLMKDSASTLNMLANVYNNLGYCLIAQQRYDEAIRIADESESVVRRIEANSGSPHPDLWLNRYNVYLDAHLQAGRFDEAEIYCNKMDSISNGTLQLYEARATILAARKQFAEALEMIDLALEVSRPTARLQKMGAKMMILVQKYEAPDVEQLFRDIISTIYTQNNEQLNAQLDEIRTQYEVDKIKAEKERIRNYLFFSFGGCLLLAILLSVYIYYNRMIQNKNRGLFRQIKEQDALVESLQQMARQYDSQTQTASPANESETSNEITDETTGKIADKFPGDLQQRKLVAHLHEYLLNERRYTNSEINLDVIVSALATNRTYLFESVKSVTAKTPVEYIHAMRLEEAKQMLETHFEINIEVIAEECGFTSRSTFYRLFRERYQISPTEYRKIAKQQI